MKALVFLLGAHALNVAHDHALGPSVPDAALPPIATTPETAGAWRRWAEAGRTPAAPAPRPKPVAAPEKMAKPSTGPVGA